MLCCCLVWLSQPPTYPYESGRGGSIVCWSSAPLWRIECPSSDDALSVVLSKAKYDLFYDPAPLVSFYQRGTAIQIAFGVTEGQVNCGPPSAHPGRSSDLSHLLPNLWEHQGSLNCRFLDKTGRQRLLTLSGRPLQLFLVYLARVSVAPAPFLLRYQNDMGRCLGAEAVAKVVLKLMAACGIDTNLVQGTLCAWGQCHRILAAGVDQTLTRQRGGWSDSRAFDVHYARLHQLVAWDVACQDGLPPIELTPIATQWRWGGMFSPRGG